MPRQARVVAVGAPHHITQRGNNRQDVFLLDEDRRTYLRFLSENSHSCELRLLGYCLMTNHVHLVAIPDKADSLARTLRRTHSRYAQWFNRRYQRSGHLWQNRFFSCGLDREHLLTALVYVDLNPVRAGLVGWAAHYPWSSAQAHIEKSDPQGLIDTEAWREIRGRGGWAERLRTPVAEPAAQRLRSATHTGAPLGEARFISALERQAGRSLELRGRGRPSRQRAVSA